MRGSLRKSEEPAEREADIRWPSRFIFLFLVSLFSQAGFAALAENETAAVRAYIQSKTSAGPSGGGEAVTVLANSLKETNQKLNELSGSMKVEVGKASRDLVILQQKLKKLFYPLRKVENQEQLEKIAQKICCEEMSAGSSKPRGD